MSNLFNVKYLQRGKKPSQDRWVIFNFFYWITDIEVAKQVADQLHDFEHKSVRVVNTLGEIVYER